MLLIENPNLILVSLALILVVLVLWFSFTYHQIKSTEEKKINFLYAELSSEKEIYNQLKNADVEVKRIEKNIKIKLIKIKVNVFNINFTLSEIF